MLTPSDLIFDLTTSLRDALTYIEAGACIGSDERIGGVVETLNLTTGHVHRFDAEAAYAALAQADALPTGKPGQVRSLRLSMTLEEAREVSEGLADILCWSRGFIAGRPDQPDDHPMGVEAVRTIRNAVRDVIDAAKGLEPQEMPF